MSHAIEQLSRVCDEALIEVLSALLRETDARRVLSRIHIYLYICMRASICAPIHIYIQYMRVFPRVLYVCVLNCRPRGQYTRVEINRDFANLLGGCDL